MTLIVHLTDELGSRADSVSLCSEPISGSIIIAPWLALPDLLLNLSNESLMGLTYDIPEESRAFAFALAASHPRILKYFVLRAGEELPPYAVENVDRGVFEIRFSNEKVDGFRMAQLSEAWWRPRPSSPCNLALSDLLTFEVDDIECVLDSFGLRLPSQLIGADE